MEITVGHTPDADDAFMFYGMSSGKVKSNLTVKHVIADIETLNNKALKHELGVTAVSAHAYAYLNDHVILKSGGSFGLSYGPIVIAKSEMTMDQLRHARIAIPGKMTSANLLLRLAIGNFDGKETPFDNIPDAVLSGEADAGLVIHESQIAYDRKKFVNALDLGKWWSEITGGLPVPLGVNVASLRLLDRRVIHEFSELFTKSIAYGLSNVDDAVEFAMQYARGQPKETVTRFVKMYVNDFTLDMGILGAHAIEKMFEMARKTGVLGKEIVVNVV
ncbi:MAG: menaquinone biosynthesis family protein [Nitrososphaera sp.]